MIRIALPAEPSYAMTKAAVDTLGRTLANAVGRRGITVNTVAPGTTRTDRTAAMYDIPGVAEQMNAAQAIQRTGMPAVVAFRASPDGGWVTGQWLDARGGSPVGSAIRSDLVAECDAHARRPGDVGHPPRWGKRPHRPASGGTCHEGCRLPPCSTRARRRSAHILERHQGSLG
ncbi:SDR family NAD(P)-dependent oxidoreductase [Actinoallomurus iriomotensis]